MSNLSSSAPDNHLVKSILTMLFCCLPFGIISLIHATKVDSLWARGLESEAYNEAAKADKWANYSLICGLIAGVIGFISALFS